MSARDPDPAPGSFNWRQVLAAALLPTLLFSLGEGAVIPVLPLVAGDLGASIALAGLVAAMLYVGQLLGDIPSGALIARIGERPGMIVASGLAALGLVGAAFAPAPGLLAVCVLVVGFAAATFALARHAFVTVYVPVRLRARGLSTLAGSLRFGHLLGPFAGAAIIAATGQARAAIWLHVGACALIVVVLLVLPDPEAMLGRARPGGGATEAAQGTTGLLATIAERRRALLTVGVAAALLGALRAARNVVLPLWAVDIGIDEATTSLVVGVAATVDFSLFYLGGSLMDRHGRRGVAIGCVLALAAGFVMLAGTGLVEQRFAWFVASAIALGLANGVGSGIVMTLGADLADRRNPAPFLGAWRFVADFGWMSGPLLLSALTALTSLTVATAGIATLGVASALMFQRFAPKSRPRP